MIGSVAKEQAADQPFSVQVAAFLDRRVKCTKQPVPSAASRVKFLFVPMVSGPCIVATALEAQDNQQLLGLPASTPTTVRHAFSHRYLRPCALKLPPRILESMI